MTNWQHAVEYKFSDSDSRSRWAWEFLRRNPQYIADYKSVSKLTKSTIKRYAQDSGLKTVRLVYPPARVLGRKWRICGDIQDPAKNSVPEFVSEFPDKMDLRQTVQYFEHPDDLGQAHTRSGYLVLVFDLSCNVDDQLSRAGKLLRQALSELKLRSNRRNFWPKKFATYLRVLDAKFVKASTHEIVKHIASYNKLVHKTDADYAYQAQKQIYKDLCKARKLTENPWSILRN